MQVDQPLERANYRIKEAAKVSGFSSVTLYRLCEEKRLTHIRRGRSIRLPVAEFHKWLDSLKVEAAA